MSFDWSNLIGAGIGAIGDVIGGIANNSMSSHQMKQIAKYQSALNYKYMRKQLINSPTFNRQGLEKAGYNPMLAINNASASGSSSWSGLANPSSMDLSDTGSSAVSNALSLRQQRNSDALTGAQVANYNADSLLKNNQSITELYSQLEKMNHADLMQAQKILTNKESNNYERIQAREDLRVANEIERTGNDFKVGIAQAIASQIGAGAQSIMAGANAQETKLRAQWIKDHPYLYGIERAGAGIAGLLGAGIGAGYSIKNMFVPKKELNSFSRNFVKKNPVGFRVK